MAEKTPEEILNDGFEEIEELEFPEPEENSEMKDYPLPNKSLHYSWDQISYMLIGEEGIKIMGVKAGGKKYPYPYPDAKFSQPYLFPKKKLAEMEKAFEQLKTDYKGKEDAMKQREESFTKEKADLSAKVEALSKELEDAKKKISDNQKPVQMSETAPPAQPKEMSLTEAIASLG